MLVYAPPRLFSADSVDDGRVVLSLLLLGFLASAFSPPLGIEFAPIALLSIAAFPPAAVY